ncbi:hypothetical protein AXZ77_1309 [Thioclava sp. ES.031]|uniref:hypothetical protein n=1 Tax=Thioclava sp. ES.031 TaxID=1798203 RepID=UPI000BF44726|nr:hypothetical protein [Thioclava sp. ES.031]PFG62723.1 hypothetical protein AXZ77_1309 [Thioclava sp. ES.031]
MTHDWPQLVSVSVGLIGAILGIFGAMFSYYQWQKRARAEDLRYEEVLKWSLQGIAALRGLHFNMQAPHGTVDRSAEITAASKQCSILLDQGRLFFANSKEGACKDLGKGRLRVNQGCRPKILDCLKVGYLAAKEWSEASEARRKDLSGATELAAQKFVDYMQMELGRSIVGDAEPASGGTSNPLNVYLNEACTYSRRI